MSNGVADSGDILKRLTERQKAISKEIELIHTKIYQERSSNSEELKKNVAKLWKEYKENQARMKQHQSTSQEASADNPDTPNEESGDGKNLTSKSDPEKDFSDLCERQILVNEKLSELYESFKGTGRDKRTKEYLEKIRDQLQGHWLDFKNNHSQILKLKHNNQTYETELVDNIVVLREEFLEELTEALEDNKHSVQKAILLENADIREPQITIVTAGSQHGEGSESQADNPMPEITKRCVEIFQLQNSHTCRICLSKAAVSLVPLDTRNEAAKSVAELILECTGIDVSFWLIY
jgi:hypothetical protein